MLRFEKQLSHFKSSTYSGQKGIKTEFMTLQGDEYVIRECWLQNFITSLHRLVFKETGKYSK